MKIKCYIRGNQNCQPIMCISKTSNKTSRIRFQYFLWLVAFFFALESCSIEKRRYTGGFHIEKHHSQNSTEKKSSELSTENKSKELPNVQDLQKGTQQINKELVSDSVCIQNQDGQIATDENLDLKKKTKYSVPALTTKQILQHEASTALLDVIQPNIQGSKKGKGNTHPDAFASLLLGIAAMGCLAGIFLTGASPVILFAGFLAAMLVFAFFATRLAKRAFKDMHYARDRFGGKAMAATGMLLGVLSIVAFLGLITIVVLGIAFVNFT